METEQSTNQWVNPYTEASRANEMARLQSLAAKIRTGELDINNGETQDMLAVQFSVLQGLSAEGLFKDGDLVGRMSNGKIKSRRELGLAVYAMINTANSLDVAQWESIEEAEKTGERGKLIDALNKAVYSDHKSMYRQDWTDQEIERAKKGARNSARLFNVLGRNFDSLPSAERAGVTGALLMARGHDIDDLFEAGVYEGLTFNEQIEAMATTEMLRPGEKGNIFTAAEQFFGRGWDIARSGMGALWDEAFGKEDSLSRDMSRLYKKHEGNLDSLSDKELQDLVNALGMDDVFESDWAYYARKVWGGKDYTPTLKKGASDRIHARWSELAKRGDILRQRDEIKHNLKQTLSSLKLEDTGKTMEYIIEGAGFAGETLSQLGIQAGAAAATFAITRNPSAATRAAILASSVSPYAAELEEARAKGMSEADAKMLSGAVGVAVGVVEFASNRLIAPTLIGKAVGTASQKFLQKAGLNVGMYTVGDAAKVAAYKAGVMGKFFDGVKTVGKNYLIEGAEETLQQAITSSIELSSDYWREDGQNLFTIDEAIDDTLSTASYMAKYGIWAAAPMFAAESAAARRDKSVSRIAGVVEDKDGKMTPIKKGVSLINASAAEITIQAYRDAQQQAKDVGIPEEVSSAWSTELTQDERNELIKKHKLSDDQVATLDAVAHYKRVAHDLGGDTTIEEDIAELNEAIDAASNEDVAEIKAELGADAKVETEGKSAEGKPKFHIIGSRGAYRLDKINQHKGRFYNLNVAIQMEHAGVDAKKIYSTTGWERGVDGKWRYDLPDFKPDMEEVARMAKAFKRKGKTLTLGDVAGDHPLFVAYPKLKEVTIEFIDRKRAFWGAYYPLERHIKLNRKAGDSLNSILIHEIQHAIQRQEGFSTGANGRSRSAYWRTAGEVEARNAQTRAEMTPEERLGKPISETEDSKYPRDNQIVREVEAEAPRVPQAAWQPREGSLEPVNPSTIEYGKDIREGEQGQDAEPIILDAGELIEGFDTESLDLSDVVLDDEFLDTPNSPVIGISEAKRKIRDQILAKIAKKAGVKIVRETNAAIQQSAKAATGGKFKTSVRYLESNGVVYGFFDPVNNELHLNEDFADLDTPIHEWSHVWWAWLEKQDPRLIERIKTVAKDTKLFKEMREQQDGAYSTLSDDDLAQEVFAQLVGKKGEDIMKDEGLSTWAKVRRVVMDFFKAVMRTLGMSDADVAKLTFDDAQAMCLRDLMDEESLGMKGLRSKISVKRFLNDAIDNVAIDNAIKDAARKRLIRNGSVVIAARIVQKGEIPPDAELVSLAQQTLPTEASDVHDAAIKVATLYAKMVFATRESGKRAITDLSDAVDAIARVQRALKTEKILSAIYKRGVIGAELYAEAKEYVDRYTRMTETGRGSKAKALRIADLEAALGGKGSLVAMILEQKNPEDVTQRIADVVAKSMGENAKPWDVLQATRKTLAAAYTHIAKTWVHSASREQALRKADAILDADSMDEVLKAGRKAESVIREKGVKLTKKALVSAIKGVVKNILAHKGKATDISEERKHSGVFIEYAKTFNRVFEKVYKAYNADDKKRKSGSKIPSTGGEDVNYERVMRDLQEEVRKIDSVLRGGDYDKAKYEEIRGQLLALIHISEINFDSLESLASCLEMLKNAEQSDAKAKAEHTEGIEAYVTADAEALELAIGSRNQADYDGNNANTWLGKGRDAVGWVSKYAYGLDTAWRSIIRFGTDHVRTNAKGVVDKLHKQERDANMRKEKELHRRKSEFLSFLREGLGLDSGAKIDAFNRKMKEARDDLSRFSIDGAKLSLDQLLNTYLGLRQDHVSARLLAMDEDARAELVAKNEEVARLWKQVSLMDEMRDVLDKEGALEYGEGLCALLRKEAGRLNEASAEYFGVLTMVQGDELYFPIRREAPERVGFDSKTFNAANVIPSAVLPRVPNSRPLDETVGATAAFMHQVNETEHFIAYGGLSRYYTALFGNKGMSRQMLKKHGKRATTLLKQHVADTINGQFYAPDPVGFSKMVNTMVDLSAIFGLGWNISTAIKQLSSMFSYANEIGWRKTFAALCSWADLPETIARLKEMAEHPLWKARYQPKTSQAFIEELSRRGKFRGQDAWKKLSRLMMLTVRGGDVLAVAIVGQGLYGATKADLLNKMNPKTGKLYTDAEATDLAMAFVMDLADRTQQAGRAANFNAIQRRGGAFGRLAGQFQSSVGQMMGSEIFAISDWLARKGDKDARDKMVTTIVNNHVIIPAITYGAVVICNAFFKGETPDEDWYWDFVLSMILGQVGGLFILGGIASQAFSEGYQQVAYPGVTLVTNVLTGVGRVVSAPFDDDPADEAAKGAKAIAKSAALTRQIVQLAERMDEED